MARITRSPTPGSPWWLRQAGEIPSMGKGRLWPSFFMTDSTVAIFGLAVALRLKICMLFMDEPIATLKGAARLSAPGLSHDKAATPTRKTSDVDHFERACRKSEDAACEVIE
jgi:hypothetical protein